MNPNLDSAPSRVVERAGAQRIAWGQELLLLAWVALLLAGADQWTKGWAVERLGPLSQDASGRFRPPRDKPPVEVFDGALRLSITGNSGAIFGLGRKIPEGLKRPLFVGMSLVAMAFITALIWGSQPNQRLRRIGLAAILAGALGNLIDRLGNDYVVDFIDWYGGFRWPTFNVADIAITAGVLLTLLDLWLHPDPVRIAGPRAAEAGAPPTAEAAESALQESVAAPGPASEGDSGRKA
ncbi:MAG: signal peptidase II [Polyangia bacterium]|nr:signal peptidase II [Polyangia bacterium]